MAIVLIDNGSKHTISLLKALRHLNPTIVKYEDLGYQDLFHGDTLVLTGGHNDPILYHKKEYANETRLIKKHKGPLIGICLGFEIIAHVYGSHLHFLNSRRQGEVELTPTKLNHLNIPNTIKVYESHNWSVPKVKKPLLPLATSSDGVEIFKHSRKPIYGLQFHPEESSSNAMNVLYEVIETVTDKTDTIKSLEQIKGVIPADKGSILLVHGHLKPSALVIMQGQVFRSTNKPSHISPRSVEQLQAILSKLNLAYISTTEIMENASGKSYKHAQEVMRFFIAFDAKIANKLKKLFDDIQNNHIEAGLLLGYPKTAVEAFLTPNMLEWEDYPKSTKEVSALNMRLLGHRLSKDNWREEVKYLEPSGQYLKKISPSLYKQMTRED